MPDREKTIALLERYMRIPNLAGAENYGAKIVDMPAPLITDTIALLKAQEPPTSESISSAIECLLHPQDADDSDMAQAIDTAVRAMRLLKAQEPVVMAGAELTDTELIEEIQKAPFVLKPAVDAVPVDWLDVQIRGYASALKSTELKALVLVKQMWQKEQEAR